MSEASAQLTVAIGEIAAHKDFIHQLEMQLSEAGITPRRYDGPRGMHSYVTDNHAVPVFNIRKRIEELSQIWDDEFTGELAAGIYLDRTEPASLGTEP